MPLVMETVRYNGNWRNWGNSAAQVADVTSPRTPIGDIQLRHFKSVGVTEISILIAYYNGVAVAPPPPETTYPAG